MKRALRGTLLEGIEITIDVKIQVIKKLKTLVNSGTKKKKKPKKGFLRKRYIRTRINKKRN